jgi:hypothetical protein
MAVIPEIVTELPNPSLGLARGSPKVAAGEVDQPADPLV